MLGQALLPVPKKSHPSKRCLDEGTREATTNSTVVNRTTYPHTTVTRQYSE